MKDVTTIKISRETKDRLEKLKEYKRETFNDILEKIFYVLNTSKKSPEKAQKILNNIDKRIKKRQIMNKRMKMG